MFTQTKILCLIVSLLFIGVFLIIDLPQGEFQISFLDIGQGDSIFIRTPDDYFVLIDSGPTMNVLEKLTEVMPRYNRTIDLIVLTHPHADHINGFVEILKRYEVKRVLLVGTTYYNHYYFKFLELAEDCEVIYARADRDFKLGSYVFLDIIWPTQIQAGKEVENVNNASVAMRVAYGDEVFMLSGDAEHEQEHEILESGFDLSANVYKAGHHGSRTASGDDFLDAVGAKTVVIQSGKDNDFKHPHKEALQNYFERGMKVRRNDLEGRIDFKLSLF